jgi:chromosome segregation ATPase
MAQLKAVEDEKAALQSEVRTLQAMNQRQQEKLVQATDEIRKSRQELQQVRTILEGWKKDMESLRQRARSAETENVETLDAIVTLLQELMGEDSPRKPSVQQPDRE